MTFVSSTNTLHSHRHLPSWSAPGWAGCATKPAALVWRAAAAHRASLRRNPAEPEAQSTGRGSHGQKLMDVSVWFDVFDIDICWCYWFFQVDSLPTKSNMIHCWFSIRKRAAEAAFIQLSWLFTAVSTPWMRHLVVHRRWCDAHKPHIRPSDQSSRLICQSKIL